MKKLKKIKIKINGKIKTIIDKLTLYELINDLEIPITKVAIELNKEIINKKRIKKSTCPWHSTSADFARQKKHKNKKVYILAHGIERPQISHEGGGHRHVLLNPMIRL